MCEATWHKGKIVISSSWLMTTMKNLIKLFCLLCFINYCFSSTPRPGLVEFEKVRLGFCEKKSQKFSHSLKLSLTRETNTKSECQIYQKVEHYKLVHVLLYDIFVRYFGMISQKIYWWKLSKQTSYWSRTGFFSVKKVNNIFTRNYHDIIPK